MTVFRAALRRHKVVSAVYFVHVRAFKIPSAGALPDTAAGGELLSGGNVYLTLDYSADTVVVLPVAHEVGVTVFKVQRWVDTALIDIYRL